MELLLKIIGSLVTPARWLYSLISDQTRIKLIRAEADKWEREDIPVGNNDGTNAGMLMFGLTTDSGGDVEITRVEVQYAAPLQLLDPGRRGFFQGCGTLNSELPFSLVWDGSISVRKDLQQAFALAARFPIRGEDYPIRFFVHARRRHAAIGGFRTEGRLRITSIERKVCLISQPVLGLTIPPRCSMTTPQPFLIEGAFSASAKSSNPVPITVNTADADGSVCSENILIGP